MNHDIPAFLKLNIDGYKSIAPGLPKRSITANSRVVEAKAVKPATHELSDHDLANSLSAFALASATSSPLDDQALLSVLQRQWSGIEGNTECVSLGAQLIAAYREPTRTYHNLSHLVECLRLWREWCDEADKPDEIAIALWFHDALYDTTRHDSEARSARWALDALSAGGVPFDTVRRIRDLVIATRPNESPSSDDARLIIDIDMAILGASSDRYEQYEADLQREHSHMAEFIYRRKRLEILKSMSTRPRIYQSAVARDALEAQARENITRSISRLQDRPTAGAQASV
jgi:predicted metal-dependent HD superfamily phosphohydrolase